jgi:cell division septation protein DedD
VGVSPVKTASAIPRPSPQQLSALLPSAGPNIPNGGDGSAKMAQSQDNVGEAASESQGSAEEVATASSSPSAPTRPTPPVALPTSSHAAEGAVGQAAPAPSPKQPAPAKKSGQLASTADQTAGTLPAPQTGRGAVFQLQLGAFLNTDNANRFQRDLNMQGFPVKVSPKKDRQGRVWQVARLGAYSDRLTAMEAAARFRRDTGLEAIVMKNTPVDEG